MSYGDFTDKQHPPTVQAMETIVGDHRALWDRLVAFVQGTYGAPYSLRFYGRNYGWALLFRKGGKALIALFPGADRLTVLVVFPEALCESAAETGLPASILDVIRGATPYKEGRWLFVPVDGEHDVAGVEILVKLKLSPPRTRR